MANLSFTYDQQIIRDLYNTADEAIAASKSLGCDGYRTYLINGETKYVPCSSYVQYENALRWRKAQGVIGAFGNDTFGNKLVGLQFANSKDEIQGDPYFTMGNFSISTSVTSGAVAPSAESVGNDPVGGYTINDIANRNLSYFSGKPYVETVQELVNKNLSVKVLFDRKKLDNHVLYSSLKERIKTSLMEIHDQYPAAMKSNAVSIYRPNITNYAYISNEDRSQFNVSVIGLSNPFNINYSSTGTTATDSEIITVYRNFAKQYSNYVVYFNGVEYPIINVTLPTPSSGVYPVINVVVNGNPFGNLININSESNNSFYIKPKQTVYDEFFDNLSDFASFLLNYDAATYQYKSDFVFPTLSDNGVIVETKETVYFPKLDDVNIDMFTDSFEKYTIKLNDLAESYDSVKTNLIARFLTTDSLKEFDTEDRKVNLIFQLYGKQFDEIRKYIDGITFMRNVSYDKVENVPDLLLKNFAHMLGFETYELEDENTLIESLFSKSVTSTTMTPAEVDIELWRRLLINAAYLFKSKGTRKSIEFILKLVGFPDDIFELNEYIYLAEKPLNVDNTLNKIYVNSTDDPEVLLNLQPFDADGYPTTPLTIPYQANGGSAIQDKYNSGPYDFGKAYINSFKRSGSVHLFELERTIDDRKSWMIITGTTEMIFDDANGYTDYYSDNTKLTINSKEFEVYVGSDRVLDVSIYRQYARNLGMVNADLTFSNSLSFDATNLSFNEFVKQSVNNFINPTNRKVISTYPTLTKIYLDYYSGTTNPMDMARSLEFLGNFDTHWIKLIQQFIPATTIYNAGKKIQNSAFNDNKFIYKHGLNTSVNWLGTDGSEFQELALRPVYLGTNKVLPNEGVITDTIDGNIPSYTLTAKQGDKVTGVLSGNERYLGSFYSISDFCDESEGRYYIWASGVNYGNDTIYSGNTNTAGPKYGVFVIYDNNVYRLNTKALFNWGSYSGITTTGSTNGLPPNAATDTYSGVTKYLWDHIDYNTDSRSVSFQDSTGITGSERSFYMNSIGAAQAFVQIGLTYDCPPPKPHVCYFDFSGRTVNLTGYTGTTLLSYTDNTGALLYIKQPKYFGYSKDRSSIKPSGTSRGYISNWTTEYKQIFDYVSGNTYYYGEYVGKLDPSDASKLISTSISPESKLYLVTGDTMYAPDSDLSIITGVTYVSDIGVNGLPSTTTGITGGLYGRYEDRVTTDPFMQVDTAYLDKIVLDPVANKASINLTKSLNLVHVFSGDTPATTYRVNDTVVGDQLYVTDSIGLTFDGFYPVNPNYVGPFYTPKEESVFIHTLQDSLALALNSNNAVSIQSLNENFNSVATDLTLIKTNPGYYLVTKSNFLTINLKLYFESQSNIDQTVKIQLLNSNQVLYDEQSFTFNGNDFADDRQFEYTYQDFFKAGDKIYLNIIPITVPCTLSRYEKIEYSHYDSDVADPLNDPRFRVLFNSGNVFNKFGYRSEGLSIKPIYNLPDLSFNEFKLNYGSGKYNVLTTPNVTYPLDPEYLLNKLYLDYLKKYTTGTLEYNTKEYDKLLGNDKIDFTFTVRSKSYDYSGEITASTGTTTSTTTATGVNGKPVSFEFNYFDYYLGNTPKQTEFSNISNTISIGKNVSRKLLNHNRTINYIPANTYLNGVALGTATTAATKTFVSYNDGLNDFTQLNYSTNILNQIRTNRRYYTGILNTTGATIFQYYTKENDVYSTELYQDLLAVAPEFNEQIINYELNDVVKVAIEDYKMVSGNTVVTQTKYKLYVCINEIHTTHCYSTTGTTGSIHPFYRPRGERSCFTELERYNPANFTPWGYEESMVNGYPNPNVIDYVYRNILTYDATLPMNYSFGDLVLATYDSSNEFFRYIYNKPTTYEPTRVYTRGEFVTSGVTEGSYLYYRYFFAKTTVPTGTPLSNTTYWTKLTNELFDHRSLASNTETGGIGSSGVTTSSYISSWLPYVDEGITYNFSSTAARLPKTLPLTNNTPYIATGSVSGYTSVSSRWNNVLLPNHIFIDRTYDILDNYEIITQNKILNNNGYYSNGTYGKGYYTGPTMGMTTGDGEIEGTNYTDVFGVSRLGVSNIYLKPSVPYNPNKIATGFTSGSYNTRSYYLRPYQGEALGLMPLFERLCKEEERNNPVLFVTPNLINFDSSSLFHAKKYTVSRGTLYKYVNPTAVAIASGVTEPALDNTNWEERDFCLVNNFTFYKDRTRIEVFESTIETLTTGVTNDLYFYNSVLNLKTGFTSKSFSGSTTNAKLVTALNKFYDVTDENRRIVTQYGDFDFRLNGTDIIMDYYYSKDEVGYPVTGEFIGKLTATNACGHLSTTMFGMLFNTNLNKLNRGATLAPTALVATAAILQNTYTVRLIINQSANATANVTVLTADSNSQAVTQNYVVDRYSTYDNKFSIIPQTDLQVTLSYSVANKQTLFKSGTIDNLSIFVNDALTSTNFVQTSITKDNNIETRVITLKNVSTNSTININLAGVENITMSTVETKNVFNVKNINIKTTQL